ncbi:hypothetical protein PO878_17200 [Iamia majanohamensis]|uniref:ATP-binding protein n=1 Tax=Iamia majanohamensis TaxID=467976 RepID=A0AAE9Y643_9ACTN|nr:hypothetical protein [Iamia majanohamensis]WCO66241.1 hypothetical protein PO878_17200 [Iamia majanohamensis]
MKEGEPAVLADLVSTTSGFRRAVNLEVDPTVEVVARYLPTPRSLEVLQRLTRALHPGKGQRAFAVTGPYGSGKSSFGVFLDALVGPMDDPATRSARTSLESADQEMARAFAGVLDTLGVARSGMLRATATAQREPVASTIVRALDHGVERFWSGKVPRGLRTALREARAGSPDARSLAELVLRISETAPVMLVLDEFGKSLEAFAGSPSSDLFVLQELAERLGGSDAGPGALVTFQHVAFEQYASDKDAAHVREWVKVQGRFEEVSFVGDVTDSVALIGTTLRQDRAQPKFGERLDKWAQAAFEEARQLGLVPRLVRDRAQVETAYPLNPVAAIALADLSRRLGQNERTMFSFLSGREPGAMPDLLDRTEVGGGTLPTIGVVELWDYFLASTTSTVRASGDGSRWLEISARLSDARGLSPIEERCAKAVGVLNLVSAGGPLRASPAVVAAALGKGDKRGRRQVQDALEKLQASGVLSFRAFADEYRVWQGSDFPIAGRIEDARQQIAHKPLDSIVSRVQPLRPVVAGRHSQQVGILRYFEVQFLGPGDTTLTPASVDADGLLVIALADEQPRLRTLDTRPLVCVTVPASSDFELAVREAAAISALMTSAAAELRDDWVARRELQENLAIARERVRLIMGRMLAGSTRAKWVANRRDLAADGNLSRLLSAVCDVAYSDAPHVRNEMLARRELTSQGAKARRLLLEAMFTREAEPHLGLDGGYGPERAMYEAVLRHTGMHGAGDDRWAFAAPEEGSTWQPAWAALDSALASAEREGVSFADLHDELAAPPIGLTGGPIPVLLAAYLLVHTDDIAVSEDGTFVPSVTPALISRLIKSPERFRARRVAAVGQRALVAEMLGGQPARLPAATRNASVLRAVVPILDVVRGLPTYASKTSELSDDARRVRSAVIDARDPVELLFERLPEACEMPAIPGDATVDRAQAEVLVERVRSALDELQQAYPRMLDELVTTMAAAFRLVPELGDLRSDLRAHCRPLVGRVIDRSLRPFIQQAMSEAFDDDIDWLEALLLTVTATPPNSWGDDDVRRFSLKLVDLAATFRRVRALHYESEADGREGFEAVRVTITSPDGSEVVDVHWLDDADRKYVLERADELLGSLSESLGPRALTALISALSIRAAQQTTSTWRPEVEDSNAEEGRSA